MNFRVIWGLVIGWICNGKALIPEGRIRITM